MVDFITATVWTTVHIYVVLVILRITQNNYVMKWAITARSGLMLQRTVLTAETDKLLIARFLRAICAGFLLF